MRTKVLEQYPHPKYPRLTIDRRNNSRFYQARTFFDGRLVQKSTKAADLPTALKIAESWYKLLLRSSDTRRVEHPWDSARDPTLAELYRSYFSELDSTKRGYAKQKWSPISDYWRAIELRSISAQTFREFYRWRRKTRISNHTLKKDVVLIRQILKYAVEQGTIPHLPAIPDVGTIKANPRPWLNRSEWEVLRKTALRRIYEATNRRTKEQRQDVYDLSVFMVASMMRVGEVRVLRFRDCEIEKNSRNQKFLRCHVVGKTGGRDVIARGDAQKIFERRFKAARKEENALVFSHHSRDSFRELLDDAGLRIDANGFRRNLKSLRVTSISFCILDNPELNLAVIARNAGTSVQMIDTFYAQRLTAEMNKEHLSRVPAATMRSKGRAEKKADLDFLRAVIHHEQSSRDSGDVDSDGFD